jgi:Fe-S-cluster-containing hydrogenase component 2
MSKKLVLNIDECTGCRACEMACSLKHFGEGNPARSLIKVLRYERMGEYLVPVPMICQQCETPMCEAVCPVKAISQDPDTGAYVVDKKKCLGCRLCVAACPVGAIEVDPREKTASKCDLCGGDPMCVKFCIQEAIEWVPQEEIGWENRRKAAARISDRLKLVSAGGK